MAASIEDLKGLNDQRKILLPDNMPPSPPLEAKSDDANGNVDVKMSDGEGLSPTADEDVANSSDDVPVSRGRGLRRAEDRANERKRKREEAEERKKEAEAAAKVPKQSKQFLKVLRDIEKKETEIKTCEEEIAILDNDLREADCGRTRVLGKDRFWNRYYWFERNGMPYGGLPNSSTAEAGYANGCIWIQGPDELEREGYIDMPAEHQNEYVTKFGVTVPERKAKEEGKTSVFNARQWGFLSEPDDVDRLLEWLDPRGFNEMKLRKEVVNYRDKISRNMANRIAYLRPAAAASEPGDEEESGEAAGAGGRKRGGIATRTRLALTPEPTVHRCQKWQNTMALEDLGHLHSEQPAPTRSRKQSRKKAAAEVVQAEVEVLPKKRATRQGTRF
jgi:hypothetical protein